MEAINESGRYWVSSKEFRDTLPIKVFLRSEKRIHSKFLVRLKGLKFKLMYGFKQTRGTNRRFGVLAGERLCKLSKDLNNCNMINAF